MASVCEPTHIDCTCLPGFHTPPIYRSGGETKKWRKTQSRGQRPNQRVALRKEREDLEWKTFRSPPTTHPPPPTSPPTRSYSHFFFNQARGAAHYCRRRGAGEESLFTETVQATGANLFQAGGNKKAGPGCQNTRWSPLPDVTTRSEASPLLSRLGLSVGGGGGEGGGGGGGAARNRCRKRCGHGWTEDGEKHQRKNFEKRQRRWVKNEEPADKGVVYRPVVRYVSK